MASMTASMYMIALLLFSLLSTGQSFQLSQSSVSRRFTGSQRVSLQMNDKPNQVENQRLDSSLQQKIATLSLAAIAVSIFPGVAEATDASMAIAKVISPVLDAFIFGMNFLFVCRTVISWYPKTDLTILPFSAIVWPTEPLLVPVRELVPPAFGVDVSAIVWISLLSFLHEILTGQQGILTLLEKT
jgi:YggT family protein